jgi:hypothetical protein
MDSRCDKKLTLLLLMLRRLAAASDRARGQLCTHDVPAFMATRDRRRRQQSWTKIRDNAKSSTVVDTALTNVPFVARATTPIPKPGPHRGGYGDNGGRWCQTTAVRPATTCHEMPGIAVLAVCLLARKSIACGVFGLVKVRVSCALPDHCLIPGKRPRTRLRLKHRTRRKAGQHATASRRPHSSFSYTSSGCILRYFVPAWAAMASADIVADDAAVSKAVPAMQLFRAQGPMGLLGLLPAAPLMNNPSRPVLYHRSLQGGPKRLKKNRKGLFWPGFGHSFRHQCSTRSHSDNSSITTGSDETDALVDDVQPTLRRTCHLQFTLNMSNGLGPGGKRPFPR